MLCISFTCVFPPISAENAEKSIACAKVRPLFGFIRARHRSRCVACFAYRASETLLTFRLSISAWHCLSIMPDTSTTNISNTAIQSSAEHA